MMEYSEFDLNTGSIYSDLALLEDILARDFFYDFEHKLEALLWNKDIYVLELPRGNSYTNDKIQENEILTKHQRDSNFRPFSWFFIKESRRIDGFELITFDSPYILDKLEDAHFFDYFFAALLKLVDLMKIRNFLHFQLQKNFDNDISQLNIFLQDLFIKYSELLNDGKREIIVNNFVTDYKSGNFNINESDESIMAVQTLAMHYLFKAIEPNMERKDTAKAKFIKMLTGKSYDNIYKAVQNPLASRKKNNRMAELEIVRKYFMDLGFSEVLNLINLDYKI